MTTPARFEPTIQSLGYGYQAPQWFADAKFGIYAHWGVYSVSGQQEWYPRNMYVPEHEANRYHIEHFGHPSTFGYKDMIPLWTAENFDPDALLDVVRRAGAKYFCTCAVHHDNFDLWNSRHHKWNAVNMGPKKDLVGMFREATLAAGLKWGVTTHLARADQWFQTNKNADDQGAYDGNDPDYWDFYFPPLPDDHDGHVMPAHREHWKARLIDLIDNYGPDLLYFDSAIPFTGPDNFQTGMDVLAHYYNRSIERHGELSSVLFIKNSSDIHGPFCGGLFVECVATLDSEHRSLPDIRYQPWQCDFPCLHGACWSYNPSAGIYTAGDILNMLTDVVSKNGCFLLNIPPKPDGTLEQRVIDLLTEIGRWMDVNGDAIYDTRPFSPVMQGDLRFTTKGNDLNIIVRHWPEGGHIVIDSIHTAAPLNVETVTMLGGSELSFHQDGAALTIDMPAEEPTDLAAPYILQARCDQPTKPGWIK
ncbi:MAG: alpha-L-fucosidase [Planctomycetota bacterium]|jgi:alpha-L-fucosidase